jgi:hypothetical protein
MKDWKGKWWRALRFMAQQFLTGKHEIRKSGREGERGIQIGGT